MKEKEDAFIFQEINYTLFKLFQISLLFRASVSSTSTFGNITLGDNEERLRRMLVFEDPGTPDQYGCVMFVMQDTQHLDKIMWSPEADKIDGYRVFRFLTGRIFWYFFLPNAHPADAANFFLSEDGILLLLKAPWPEELVIQRLASRIAESRKKIQGDGS